MHGLASCEPTLFTFLFFSEPRMCFCQVAPPGVKCRRRWPMRWLGWGWGWPNRSRSTSFSALEETQNHRLGMPNQSAATSQKKNPGGVKSIPAGATIDLVIDQSVNKGCSAFLCQLWTKFWGFRLSVRKKNNFLTFNSLNYHLIVKIIC